VVSLPDEAADTSSALRLADSRMYAQKQRQRSSAGSQSKDVLLRALQERSPALVDNVADVAELASDVGRHLGLAGPDLDQLRNVAELHDVGKVAIPERILCKPGPLDFDEWAVMKTHPAVGEDIVRRVGALREAVAAVRHHHERVDGTGYPDRLAGAAIPIEARIVAAADAYAAMTSDRVYSAARTPAEAAAELLRSAGSHLDPGVVDALLAVLGLGELPTLRVA
jgi:two-component system, cell cycle response regulator